MRVTQEKLRSILAYDPETGLFRWLVSRPPRGRVGKVAGYDNGSGYIKIAINGEHIYAHRLAFLWMTGCVPEQIDHINQVRSDNRWSNLRSTTHRQNFANVKSRDGYRRVGVRLRHGKWYARYGKEHLGVFATRKDAITARKRREVELCGHDPNAV